ncbi:monovalent cation/H+ antiporter complex subunit F [Brachybacterium sp. UNK5269]|uniref:monovalent cation/H+ antiporter complex subunit F n=1 Tax=Brachybacterium sp. UNK5269 TaxID=3408576 RepID=UPI003BB0B828
MSAFDIVLVVSGGITALAALGVVYRMVVGPTILDRAISSDSLVTLVVLGMALYTAQAELPWAGPAMLALSGLAFIGTVTFARFVAREEPKQGYRPASLREPSTDTGPHEAIHADPEAPPEQPFDQLPATQEGTSATSDAADPADADAPSAKPDPAVAPTPSGGPDPAEEPAPAAEADEDSEAGFGAEGGSRNFDDGAGARWPDAPTEGTR